MNICMKKVLFGLAFAVAIPLFAQQKPVYLDAAKPVERRVEDALKRLTIEEKVAMLHAQSKFSSPGVPAWAFRSLDDGRSSWYSPRSSFAG